MSYYRIWEYPRSNTPFKHCYIKREHLEKSREVASENSAAILAFLEKQDHQQSNDEKFSQSLSRSRRTITDLILCNDFDYFCTFTFDGHKIDRYNFKECKKKLSAFFMNFKNRYAPDFKYLVIPEFHKDGAVHFHGVCSGFPVGELTVPKTVFKRVGGELIEFPNVFNYHDWQRYHRSFGFFNCSKIRNYAACAFYVSKYITKDLISLDKGTSVYMCSKGLNRPQLVFDEPDVPMLFVPEFESDFVAVGWDRVAEQQDWYVNKFFSLSSSEFSIDDFLEISSIGEIVYSCYQMKIDDFFNVRFTPYEAD